MVTDLAIKKQLRKIREKSIVMYDDESFNVSVATGKLALVADLTCFDKGTLKIVKNCFQQITPAELEVLLNFNDSQLTANTILEICFWANYCRHPFKRIKLFYNQPEQKIPADLKPLVK